MKAIRTVEVFAEDGKNAIINDEKNTRADWRERGYFAVGEERVKPKPRRRAKDKAQPEPEPEKPKPLGGTGAGGPEGS